MTYSHMGEPHYHWRIGVSLLSSGRDQVVHSCYGRQHNWYDFAFGLIRFALLLCLPLLGQILHSFKTVF